MKLLLVVTALAGCGIGFQRALVTEEVPVGTCSKVALGAGESCTRSADDYTGGVTVGRSSQTAWFRWPLFDASLDERVVREGGTRSFHSLAGGVGTHLRPLIVAPDVQRYIDPVVNLGGDLGGIWVDSHVQTRADLYAEGALDLYVPDIGSMRYTETGVPGVRVSVRYTAYAEGWDHDVAVQVGLIWRYGNRIELLSTYQWQRTGD
ncbi:MAG: hypothetical protein QM831_32075 [Kofleriaceae bacterium]